MRWSKSFLHPPRGPRRRRGRLPQAPLPRGVDQKVAAGIYSFTPMGFRSLKKMIEIVREEMDRTGALEVDLPIAPAEGALGRVGAVGPLHERRDPLPPRGPQGDRVRPRADGRGGGDRHGPPLGHLVAAAAVQPLPDPDEVPRRDPPPLRPPARARVPDEGRLLLRRRPEGARRPLREDGQGVPDDLRALRPRVRARPGRLGRHRRLGLRGVHGRRRHRRGRARLLRGRRVRREHREGDHGAPPRAVGGRGGEAVRQGRLPDARASSRREGQAKHLGDDRRPDHEHDALRGDPRRRRRRSSARSSSAATSTINEVKLPKALGVAPREARLGGGFLERSQARARLRRADRPERLRRDRPRSRSTSTDRWSTRATSGAARTSTTIHHAQLLRQARRHVRSGLCRRRRGRDRPRRRPVARAEGRRRSASSAASRSGTSSSSGRSTPRR